MKNSDCVIEQYRGGRLVRTFTPSGDQVRPWRMEVNGKSYLRTNGWVLSKILPTLVDGSRVTTRVVQWTPVTLDHCDHVEGPFYHGTKSVLSPGDELTPGFGSNFQDGRVSNNIYFSALIDTAAWGAQLATALAGGEGRGYIYVVEPTGPFEDDPNVTNKRFPGNPTRSYRTRDPLRVVRELVEWEEHSAEELSAMLEHLARLREQGLDTIED
jgi:rifampin ADP-ribosylating transferase